MSQTPSTNAVRALTELLKPEHMAATMEATGLTEAEVIRKAVEMATAPRIPRRPTTDRPRSRVRR